MGIIGDKSPKSLTSKNPKNRLRKVTYVDSDQTPIY